VVKVVSWGGGFSRALSRFFMEKMEEKKRRKEKKWTSKASSARARERDIIYTLSLPDDKMYARSDHTRY
jgi:hypothetical protein